MLLFQRTLATNPYDQLPVAANFTVSSTDLNDGQPMDPIHTAVGGSISPHLSWSGFPQETKSFVVTCFDPDCPTPSGFWHWVVLDIPDSVTELPTNCGASDLTLEGQAFHGINDLGTACYIGAAPPKGDRAHRYIFAIHALDVDSLELSDELPAGGVAFHVALHTIALATLTVTHQIS